MHSHGRLWERGFVVWVVGLGFLLVGAVWASAATSAGAQAGGEEIVFQGETVFRQICAACHTIGGGARVGPDLQGVTERREGSWLKVHIQSPSVHHDQNDPVAKANFEKFGMRMPTLGLTDQQVEAVIAYLGAGEPAQAARPALYIPTLAIGVLAIVGFTSIGLIVARKRVEVRP